MMNDTLLYLKIVNPNLNDSGLYECQISYHDDSKKKLKMSFTRDVVGKIKEFVYFLKVYKI